MVNVLGTLGADANTPNNDGTTPMFMTAQKGLVNIVNALGVVGAYANAPHMKEML